MKLGETEVSSSAGAQQFYVGVLTADTPQVYISKPADPENEGNVLLLFLTNGVGVHSINNQIQADRFAQAGYFVVMPDLSV